MSGIVGVVHLDGRPVGEALARDLLASIAPRGPDRQDVWRDGPVALGQAMLATTPEAEHEVQPLHDRALGLTLVLHGRVDDRDGLRTALEQAGQPPRDDTDAELVLRAYAAWGEGCPSRIIGDFAFAIWDARRRRLFCARDVMGIKPFYYHHAPGRLFVFGSEVQAVLRHPDVPRRVNEGFVAELLSTWSWGVTDTVWADVLRLPPAHACTLDARGLQVWRYWRFDTAYELRLATDADYDERFLATLREAVRCRLRAVETPMAMLSGGLDSSSVCAIAQELLGGRERLKTISLRFPDDPAADEGPFIRAVVEHARLDSAEVTWTPRPWAQVEADVRAWQDLPLLPNSMFLSHAAVQARGRRVSLSGLGGDDWLSGSPYRLADQLRSWEWLEAASDLSRLGARRAARSLLVHGLSPLVHPALDASVTLLRGRGGPAWLEPDFVARTDLPGRLQRRRACLAGPSRARAHLADQPSDSLVLHLENEERIIARLGIELRSPFLDRRLAELCLSLPETQRYRRGTSKVILRRAMGTRLPSTVRHRRGKASFSGTVAVYWTRARQILPTLDADWLAPRAVVDLEAAGPYVRWHALATTLWARATLRG